MERTFDVVEVIRTAGRHAGTLEDLGAAVHNSTSHSASLVKTEDGDNLMYLALDGSQGQDARFGIVDINEERLKQTLPMPGAMGGFSMTAAGDGSIYVSSHSQGNVYRFTPWDGELEVLGKPTPETTFGYALIPCGKDGVFGGTYPGAVFFEYTTHNGFLVHGPQPFAQGEHYVRSLAHLAELGISYVGIGSHARLKRYNHTTGEIRELLPDKYWNDEFVYNLDIEGGKLFVRLNPSNRMLVYDLTMDSEGGVTERLEREVPGVGCLGVSPEHEGSVYYTSAGILHRYVIETGRSESLGIDTTIMPFELDFTELADQETYPGQTLIGIGSRMGRTRMFKFNPVTGAIRLIDLDIDGVPTNIQCVVAGSDGNIYIGAFLVGGTSVLNPETAHFTEYKGVGQTENIAEIGGKMYFSVYPHAKLFEYDPKIPWTLSEGGSNPRMLFDLSDAEQDRPYALAVGGEVLYIGTICGYGKLGGSIVAFRPATGERKVYRNPLPDLSVVSLVYRNGMLYGATNVWGGLGIDRSRTEAELLVFDTAAESVRGVPLPIAGLKAITSLTFSPEGMLWGMAEGYVFAFDITDETCVHLAHLFPEIRYGDQYIWRDASLRFGKDGALYGTVQGKYLFRYDTARFELDVLVEDGARFLAEDEDGRLYFSDGKTRMRRYTMPV